MGVPVVTLRGDRHVGRVGTSILYHIGLSELIAENKEQYVNKAIILANDFILSFVISFSTSAQAFTARDTMEEETDALESI